MSRKVAIEADLGRGALSDRAFVQRLRTAGGPSHELLVLLDQHRVLTTNQLARVTGAPVGTVSRDRHIGPALCP
ncbi:hypothetical protein GCM10010429_23010 [Micromonospora olivasterospora]|uniref:Uncharacterized protein n=1 Tax=Micromonospora olivasterospora TaxID=1880 RepID=A0A562HV05_MICOL|nr:hypothetical protein JD77_06355 [Micromonospora olivasterospora]